MAKRRCRERRRRVVVPRPDRVRTLRGIGFGWLTAALWRDGWLALLTPQAAKAYMFLCLVADCQGVSYYRRDRIGRALDLDVQELHAALTQLEKLDLVAYRPFRPGAADGFRQVLNVPAGGPASFLPPEVLLSERLSTRRGPGTAGK